MARAKGRVGEESRARLLTTAAQIFADKGYHAAKVSDIVAAAGLTQAAFYLYFPSKESIFADLVADFQAKLRVLADAGRLVTPLPRPQVPEQVQLGLQALYAFFAAHPELTRIALLQADVGEPLRAEIVAMIEANLRRNQAAGHVRPDLPVRVAAECMAAVVERAVARWLLTGEKDPAALAAATANVMLYGLLTKE